MGLVASWAVVMPTADADVVTHAVADDAEPAVVQQASYSTGSRGSQLTWLPYRPTVSPPAADSQAAAPANAASSAASVSGSGLRRAPAEGPRLVSLDAPAPALRPAGAVKDPFDDPFGDRLSDRGIRELPLEEPAIVSRFAQPPADIPAETIPRPTPELPPGLFPENGPRLPEEIDEFVLAPPVDFVCPQPTDLTPIHEITHRIEIDPGDFPQVCPLSDRDYRPHPWSPMTYTWKASALCHKPTYFEQVHVERYGHTWGPYLQPILSGGHFFVTLPILPYKMGLHSPQECMYPLGYYRPGSCAPYMIDPLPLSVRAGLIQAGAVLGAVHIIP